ncbi:MAG: CHAT domain-containing tetratricopeptide repeat protein [Chitinophagales bacterium]
MQSHKYLQTILQQTTQLVEQQQYQQASFLLQQTIAALPLDSTQEHIAAIYAQWGFCNYYLGQYKEGITHFERAISVYTQIHENHEDKIADCYNDMGTCYGRLGDYEQELTCYEKALVIRLQQPNIEQESLAESYHNIGHAYGQMKQYDKQLEYLHKTLEMSIQQLGKTHLDLAFSYHSIAWAHYFLEDGKNALLNHEKALQLRQENPTTDRLLIAQSHNHLAWYWFYLEKYELAIQHHEKALIIRLQYFGALHEDCIISNHGIAKCYQRLGKYDLALQRLQKCLQNLVPDFGANDIGENPSLQSYTFPLRLYECLRDKSWCFYLQYQVFPQSTSTLRQAFDTYLLTTQLIDQIRNSYQGEGSKLILADETTWLFEHAIEAAICLHEHTQNTDYLEAAFTFSEKSKSLLLLSSLKDATAKIAASIPNHLLQKEQQLRTQLTQFDQQITAKQVSLEHQKSQNWMTDTELRQLQGKHFDLLQTYTAFIHQLENDFPDYYQLKYDITTVSLKEVQNQLPAKTCLLSYFVGEKKIYIFEVSTSKSTFSAKVHHFNKPDDFGETLEEYLETIEDMSRKPFIQKAFQLYEWLIAPTSIEQYPIENLVIIPHGQLSQFPFEALITEAVSPRTPYPRLPYLLQQFDVSYHYSATLLCHSTAPSSHVSEPPSSNGFVGFAPVYTQLQSKDLPYFENLSNLALVYTEKEVQSIQQLFEHEGFTAKSYCHLAASKAQFLAAIVNQKYIHIAAHGIVNQRQMALSGILFSPKNTTDDLETGMLYIGESYNLKLSADLVVLSCCESGIGKLASGEGMMAINRGFLYAGAKNVIFTLFKVYDEESAQLTQLLYEGMLKGLSVAKALAEAKRVLIEMEDVMPILWSGYVLIGGD